MSTGRNAQQNAAVASNGTNYLVVRDVTRGWWAGRKPAHPIYGDGLPPEAVRILDAPAETAAALLALSPALGGARG